MKIISIEFAASEAVMAQFFGSVIVEVTAEKREMSASAKGNLVIPAADVVEADEITGRTEEQTIEVELPVVWREDGEAAAHFTFEFNDEVIEIHQPEETWRSGKHSILLYYPMEGVIANYRNIFNVYMRMSGGSTRIDTGNCLASISGQSMGAGEVWDGEIKIEERIVRVGVDAGIKAAKLQENLAFQIDETMKRSYVDVMDHRVTIGAFAMPIETEV